MNLLCDSPSGNKIQWEGGDLGWVHIAIPEQPDIRLFFWHMLWKAHICTEGPYEQFDLGPHALAIKRIVEGIDPPGDRYPIDLRFLVDDPTKTRGIEAAQLAQPPVPGRRNGRRTAVVTMFGWVAVIEIDSRSPTPSVAARAIVPGEDYRALAQPLSRSPEFRGHVRAARQRSVSEQT